MRAVEAIGIAIEAAAGGCRQAGARRWLPVEADRPGRAGRLIAQGLVGIAFVARRTGQAELLGQPVPQRAVEIVAPDRIEVAVVAVLRRTGQVPAQRAKGLAAGYIGVQAVVVVAGKAAGVAAYALVGIAHFALRQRTVALPCIGADRIGAHFAAVARRIGAVQRLRAERRRADVADIGHAIDEQQVVDQFRPAVGIQIILETAARAAGVVDAACLVGCAELRAPAQRGDGEARRDFRDEAGLFAARRRQGVVVAIGFAQQQLGRETPFG